MTKTVGGKLAFSRRGLGRAGIFAALAGAAGPAVASSEPVAAPLGVADRLAIEDLFSAYVWAYDCSDVAEFLSLFSDEGLVVGRGTTYRGKEAITGWFNYLLEMRENEGDDVWMHEAGQFRVHGNSSPVIVYAYATHFNGNSAKATRGVRSLGYFVCECIKTEAGWKFRRFSITPWDRTRLPWKKPLPWATS